MNEKNIIKLVVFIFLLIVFSFYYFIKIPVKMVEKECIGIKSLYPDVKEKKFFRYEWDGCIFINPFFDLLVVSKKMERAEFLEILNENRTEHKLFLNIKPFADSGSFFIHKTKNGFKAIQIFYYEDRTYWLDFYSSMPFNKYYEVMKTFLLNMKIDNKKVDEEFEKKIKEYKVPLSIIINSELFVLIISFIFIFVIFIILLTFQIGFRKPNDIKGVILEEKTFVTANFKFTRSNFPAYVCIISDKLYGFSAGKKVFEKDLKDIKLIKDKIHFDINGVEYSFRVSQPERWKIYM